MTAVLPMRAERAAADHNAAASAATHVEFLGLRFCTLAQEDVIGLVLAGSAAAYRYVVTPNSHHVVSVHKDPQRLLPVYRSAWLSACDSRIVRTLARLQRLSLPLVTGSDLVAALMARLDGPEPPQPPRRLLIVGPPRNVVALLRARFPRVTFEVLPAPAGLSGDAEARLAVARACVERPWDIALLCVGAPTQELIAREIGMLGRRSGIALCVGASIDFLTGTRKRAPRWMQAANLEWAYRLGQEPRRLWRRYLVESPQILRIFVAARLQQRRWGRPSLR